jgi:NAD(P)-dependent dehydrogenase (short-subunit alcohol dehydrogenase family)
MRLEGKVAVITGAGSGIGRACALRFAREGATVICAGKHLADEAETAAGIRSAGGTADARAVDVSDEQAVSEVLDETLRLYGRLDILVNNAGIGAGSWDATIAVNLSGVYYGTMHGAGLMAERGGGSIVNVSSILGLVGTGRLPDFPELDPSAYVASKHGILGLTKAFALSYARLGVRVNALCPGYIETPMIAGLVSNPEIRGALEALHPLGRLGQADEVAAAALFLASDDASFVTGTALAVDGGYTAQ